MPGTRIVDIRRDPVGAHRRVLVIGGGAAGSTVAARLLRTLPREVCDEVVLIEPAERAGPGAAYSTADPRHQLNVPAGRMSARTGEVGHLVRWMRSECGVPATASTFIDRGSFGRYLADELHAAEHVGGATLRHVRDRVVDVVPSATGIRVRTATGYVLDSAAAVLAVGVPPRAVTWLEDEIRAAGLVTEHPWTFGALDAIPDVDDVLIIGTGLTMADVATSLDRPGRRIRAMSRRGLPPRAHVRSRRPTPAAPQVRPDADLEHWVRWFTAAVARSRAAGEGWRQAVDQLRPVTAQVWRHLDDADRRRFVERYAPMWEAHRHRLSPETAQRVDDLRRSGRLRICSGEVATASIDGRRIRLELVDGRSVTTQHVVVCAGPEYDLRRAADPLLAGLLDDGVACPGPLGLGLATSGDGRLIAGSDDPPAPLWAIGSLRRGDLYETTAFPEIRAQADSLAESVLAELAPSAARTA
jgi:uncharacterized NAD(P)/FAD-binding protein YdhS